MFYVLISPVSEKFKLKWSKNWCLFIIYVLFRRYFSLVLFDFYFIFQLNIVAWANFYYFINISSTGYRNVFLEKMLEMSMSCAIVNWDLLFYGTKQIVVCRATIHLELDWTKNVDCIYFRPECFTCVCMCAVCTLHKKEQSHI